MKKTTIYYGWWIVLASSLTGFYVAGTIFYGFTAFVDPLVMEFGWSYTQISFASSLRGLEMGIFAPIVGIFVDRLGSRIMIRLGMIVMGASLILLAFTHSLVMFYAAFLLLALGAGGCTSVVVMAVVANWFDKKVGLAMGIAICGFGAAGLLVPIVVKLIELFQWRTTYIILGIGAWGIGIPMSFIIRNKPEDYGYLPDGEPLPEVQSETDASAQEEDISFRKALKNRFFLSLLSIEAIRMLIVGTLVIHVMPYLNSLGIPRSTAGLVAAGIPICSMIGRFGFGWLGDILDKRYILSMTFILTSAGLFIFSYLDRYWLIPVFLLLFGPGYGGGMTMRGSILREYFGRVSFGKLIGLTMGIASIAGIIGPTLGGWVFDTFGSYHYLWISFACLSMVGIIIVLRLPSTRHRTRNSPSLRTLR
ncbi:MAG: MFS transporter [Deltaproteobacteria bacterium]|nr:MFS transporter [Deltaproteobacteria bacterium]MBW2050763.1 MFS transporter [Deltaproteobacteria bacterium]MBW2141371.1 MFS transporter [Deltaproteobacteria bacterium]MBW2321977.1 MFS transporter [Deltaproteobacteria bacterium]